MSHATEWLVKWTVWERAGVWLGDEKGQDRGPLVREIGPDQQCHRRSGKKYGLCHRAEDEAHVVQAIMKNLGVKLG